MGESGFRLHGHTDRTGSHMRGDDRRQRPERGLISEFAQPCAQQFGIGCVNLPFGVLQLEVNGVLGLGHLGGGLSDEGDDLLQRFGASAYPGERNDDSGVEAEHGNDLQGPAQQR